VVNGKQSVSRHGLFSALVSWKAKQWDTLPPALFCMEDTGLALPRRETACIRCTPNQGLELTAYSVRSSVAPASSRSSGLALDSLCFQV
jgi:hypothetical protein